MNNVITKLNSYCADSDGASLNIANNHDGNSWVCTIHVGRISIVPHFRVINLSDDTLTGLITKILETKLNEEVDHDK